MPTYEYKREDGSTFEIQQRITEAPLTECPTTGQKVKRIISAGAGLVFKGSGFYQTDYVRKSDGGSPSKTTSSPSTDSGSDTSSTKSDSSSTSESSTSKKD